MTAAQGTPDPSLAGTPMRDVFGDAILSLGARNPRVVVLDGDLGNSTKVDAFAEAYPDRFFQMGIAEQNMAGVAAGLALAGLIPYVTTFAAFAAFRDLDQVRVSIAQSRAHVVICGTYAGLLASKAGKTHVCLEDLALMRAIPYMTVLSPGDPREMIQAVELAADLPGPVYIRVSRDPAPEVLPDGYHLHIGKAVVVRDGGDVALITTGAQLGRTVAAADRLAAEGIHALVLHVPTIKPIDVAAIVDAARRTGAVVTAEDHSIVGGLGGAVAEVLGEHAPTPMRRVGTADVAAESGANDELLRKYGLTADHVVAAAREVMTRRRPGPEAAGVSFSKRPDPRPPTDPHQSRGASR
jgi:transketolase